MKKRTLGSVLLLSVSSLAQPPAHDGSPKPPPVAERWAHDSTKLQLYVVLSPTQISSIKSAFLSFYHSMDALMQNKASAPPAREAVEQIIKSRDEAVIKLFTPEQNTRFHTFRKELTPPPHRGEGGGPSPINL